MNQKLKKILSLAIPVLLGLFVWFTPCPEGVNQRAWQLLAIFVFTIAGVIAKPLPMGAVTLIGMALCGATKTLTVQETLSGFSNGVVWLIVVAFFIAFGFIKTGLGSRMAYSMMSVLGKSTLGMGYGVALTDLVLAPAIPSMSARAGGIMYPILKSICQAFGSEPHSHPKKMGSFLFQVAFQTSCVTSAMFLTAMAGNPLIADIAAKAGIKITWSGWALAALLPGLVSLIVIPLVIYWLYPPEVKFTPDAKSFSRKQLRSMGKISTHEWIMLFTFVLLLVLWSIGEKFGITAGVTALIGLAILLVTGVLDWEDVIKEKGAWNILIWFSALLMMADYLTKLGLADWFSKWIVVKVQGYHWTMGFSVLAFVYFYTHYFFASNVAHIGAMYGPFLFVALAMGTPPLLAALSLGFISNLFGSLTHYGCGPAPIFFGAGYVKIGDWWKLGLISSIVNIVIWTVIGLFWWKVTGLF